jgi:hypothetical protein
VEQLHVQAVARQARELCDPVALLEDEHELGDRVVDPVELVEAEQERRGRLARDEEDLALDVVCPVEVPRVPDREGRKT